jgi:hypothetical protein
MDGWEFLKTLDKLNQNDFLHTRLFLYTSSVYYGDKEKARNFSIVKKLYVKPITENDILEMISD